MSRRQTRQPAAAAQDGWDYNVFDAQPAYLQSDGIESLLLFRMPHKNPPPGTKPGQVFVATGPIYGTRDAGRQKLEQGLYYLTGPDGPEAIAHAHVDAFLIAFREASQAYRDALRHPVHTLHLKQQTGTVV